MSNQKIKESDTLDHAYLYTDGFTTGAIVISLELKEPFVVIRSAGEGIGQGVRDPLLVLDDKLVLGKGIQDPEEARLLDPTSGLLKEGFVIGVHFEFTPKKEVPPLVDTLGHGNQFFLTNSESQLSRSESRRVESNR